MSEYSVELKGLNKVYSNLLKEDTIALKDINLQIRPGEFISIIGPSGCGKSTLLRIIGNLDKPTSGTIGVSRRGRPADGIRISGFRSSPVEKCETECRISVSDPEKADERE